jgi:hypothetical protein
VPTKPGGWKNAIVGVEYTDSILASTVEGSGAVSGAWSGDEPGGLDFSTNGARITLSGRPRASGRYNFTVSIAESLTQNGDSRSFTIDIFPKINVFTGTTDGWKNAQSVYVRSGSTWVIPKSIKIYNGSQWVDPL